MNLLIVTRFLLLALVLVFNMEYDFVFANTRADGEIIVRCLTRERKALLKFKEGLVDIRGMISSWEKETECCKWEGVQCDNTTGRVIALQLAGHHLRGEINQLWNLPNLKTLDLSSNKFNGTIPSQIGNLTNLRSLDLSSNQFSRTLPSDIGNLTNLVTLDLSSNQFSGTIPPHIRLLSKLEELDVSFNYMEATITEADLTYLPNLKLLGLSFNSFTLDISPDWTPPFQLSVIGLSGCNLGPHFPSWLQTQTDFTWLDLSLNNISGEIPPWLSSFSQNLFYLNISHNQLSGTISNEFSTIEIIDVSSNKFSGPMPIFSPSTWIFQISRNMFSGSFSFNCSSPYSLSILDLSNNQLSGKLPNCWGDWDALRILNLSNNSFSGEIPHDLGSLSNLKKLHLANNNLSGDLPSTLQKCKSLQLIDFGEIDRVAVFNEYTIGSRKCNFAKFRRKNLMFLKLIDLSSNRLVGNIPRSLSSLKALLSLNLSGNRLTGIIDPDIGQMSSLEALDLSSNHLSGPIPVSIEKIIFLSFLDLANNNLSGEIPIGGQLSTFPASVYAGNIGLCGILLTPCSVNRPNPSNNNKAPKHVDDDSITSLSFLKEIGIPIILGFIVGFWGVVGSLVVNESWRRAFYNCWSAVGDWFYVWANIYWAKLRRN